MSDNTKRASSSEEPNSANRKTTRRSPRVGTGIAIVVCALAGLGWAGWWLFRKALASGLESATVVGVITALVCTVAMAWSIQRSGAQRAARLRGRAETYEAVLALIFRAADRKVNKAERRRTYARLLLWGSNRVIEACSELADGPWSLDLDEPRDWAKVETVLKAMRQDLGQPPLYVELAAPPEEDDD